ncbi:MAG: hypothetical protein R2787_05950 [Saprospiraceae bacterium]
MKYAPLLLLFCLAILSCRKEDTPQPCDLVQAANIATPKWEVPFDQPGNEPLSLLHYAQWTPQGILAKRTNFTGPDTLMLLDPDSGQSVWHTSLFNTHEPGIRTIKLDQDNSLVWQDHLLIGYRSFLHVIDLASGMMVTHALEQGDFDGFGQSPHPDRFWYSTKDCPGSDIVYTIYESDIAMSSNRILKTDAYPVHTYSDSYFNIHGWNAPDGETYLFVRMVDSTAGDMSLIMLHPESNTEVWRKEKTGNRFFSMNATQVIQAEDYLFVHNPTTDQLTAYQLPEGEERWSVPSTRIYGMANEWIYAATPGFARIHMATGMIAPLPSHHDTNQFAGLDSGHTYFIRNGHCVSIRNTGGCADLTIEHPVSGENGFWSTTFFHADAERKRAYLTDLYSLYAYDLP